MKLNPESFKGKVYLLVIDKIIIGAIIAVAFVVYDRYRTAESQRLQASAATIQLTFERARLAKEFLPFIIDKKEDVIARGYTLREAARTGSIDADAAVEIGRQLLADGISDDHFRKVMVVIVPDGFSSIARRGAEMAIDWRKISNEPFDPAATFDPVSGRENIPGKFAPLIREGRLWRAVLEEGFSDVGATACDSLQEASKVAPLLYGLFVLMHPGNQIDAILLSRSPCHAVALVGHLSRVLFSGRDEEALRYLSGELGHDHASIDNLRVDRIILGIRPRLMSARSADSSIFFAHDTQLPDGSALPWNRFTDGCQYHDLPSRRSLDQRTAPTPAGERDLSCGETCGAGTWAAWHGYCRCRSRACGSRLGWGRSPSAEFFQASP